MANHYPHIFDLKNKVVVPCPPIIVRPIPGVHPLGTRTIAGCYGTWIEVPPSFDYEHIPHVFTIRQPWATMRQVEPLVMTVAGSKGQTYTVRRSESGQTTCTCVGFKYRQDCKHAQTVAKL